MSIIKAIEKSFKDKESRKWDTLYWSFDIHGTILKPNYQRGKTPTEFYPYAKESLQLITSCPDIVCVLYTCSHQNEIDEYIKLFEEHNIKFKYINENPDVPTDINGYGCYDKKFYMNVLFEDKAGFSEEDWVNVLEYMKEKLNTK
jgi:hypothetical protein